MTNDRKMTARRWINSAVYRCGQAMFFAKWVLCLAITGLVWSGLGRCILVRVTGLGSKARSRPGFDGVWCLVGSLPICFSCILVYIYRGHQTVL